MHANTARRSSAYRDTGLTEYDHEFLEEGENEGCEQWPMKEVVPRTVADDFHLTRLQLVQFLVDAVAGAAAVGEIVGIAD